MTREEFFNLKNAGALWDVGVSINRTNPLPLDKNAVFDTYEHALTYAQGVLAYPGQFIAVVGESSVEAYLITVAGAGAALQKLAATSSSGDVDADLAALATRVGNLEALVGKKKTESAEATGLIKDIDDVKEEIGKKKVGETAASGIYKYVDDSVAQAKPTDYDSYKTKVDTLVGEDSEKSARAIAAEEVAKIVDGADASYDTLKEVAEWISTHGSTATQMNTQINANKAAIDKLNGDATKDGSVAKTVSDAIDSALKTEGKDKYALASDLATTNTNVSSAQDKITALETKTAGLKNTENQDVTVKAYVDSAVSGVDAKITAVDNKVTNLGSLASKSEVAESDLASDLKTKIDGKADKATTLAGYGIEDAYTKTGAEGMVDGKIEALALGTMSKEKAADYTKTADLETALSGKYDAAGSAKAVDDKLPAINSAVSANTEAIKKLNGAKTVEGSVAKKIDDAITGLDLANTYAAKAHTHEMAQVNGLADELAKYQAKGDYAKASDLTSLKNTVGEYTPTGTGDTIVKHFEDADTAIKADVSGVKTKVDTLVGDDANLSARAIAADELAKQLIPENAKESLDTLQEIAAWIQSHPDNASAMSQKITTLEGKAHEHSNKTVLDGITQEKVNKWDSAITRLPTLGDGVDENGYGMVKLASEDSVLTASSDGTLTVSSVPVSLLTVSDGDELILFGSNA